jgi:glycosyltransferase involved in cell wall biosynthesis
LGDANTLPLLQSPGAQIANPEKHHSFIQNAEKRIPVKISIIGCPFQTAFGSYIESLITAIQKQPDHNEVRWIGSNCGCNVPAELERHFQTRDCEYFEMPNRSYYGPSKHAWKRWLRVRVNDASYYQRARRYAQLSRGSEVVHFQQVLNAFGSSGVFQWLKQPSNAARVVTIHEFDDHQRYFRERNKVYNRAGALIVHCEEMKDELVEMGISKDKVHVVLNGTELPPLDEQHAREDIVFHCGHNPMSGKGLPTLFKAMAILKSRLGINTPRLKVHGHYPAEPPQEAKRIAEELGINDLVTWLNQLPVAEVAPLYQHSVMLVLPYSKSFAGEAAATAAANGLPVVCTKKAGIPDHLGDWGVWVEEDNPEQLAERILELLEDEQRRKKISAGLRKRAEDTLNWDLIAEQTLGVYRAAIAAK